MAFCLTEIQIGMWVKFNELTKLAVNDHLKMLFKKLGYLISGLRIKSMDWSSDPRFALTESYSTWEVLEGVRNISSSPHDSVCQSQRQRKTNAEVSFYCKFLHTKVYYLLIIASTMMAMNSLVVVKKNISVTPYYYD